ncbi:MAG: hypothetical protein ACM3SY_13390 [Candidatus Omnitrophota bacterium]
MNMRRLVCMGWIILLMGFAGVLTFGQAAKGEAADSPRNGKDMLPSNYIVKFTIQEGKNVNATSFVVASSKYSASLSNEAVRIMLIEGQILEAKNNTLFVKHWIRIKDPIEPAASGLKFTERSIETSSYVTLDQELTLVDFGSMKIKCLITQGKGKS